MTLFEQQVVMDIERVRLVSKVILVGNTSGSELARERRYQTRQAEWPAFALYWCWRGDGLQSAPEGLV